MVTVETKAPEGIGAAFLPVPPAHMWNWVSGHCLVPEQGSAVHCRLLFRQRERRCQKSATILSPASEPRVLEEGGGPQKILKPFSSVRVGALRLLWARDDFTVTSLAWATAGISFRLTVESVLKVQLASP